MMLSLAAVEFRSVQSFDLKSTEQNGFAREGKSHIVVCAESERGAAIVPAGSTAQ